MDHPPGPIEVGLRGEAEEANVGLRSPPNRHGEPSDHGVHLAPRYASQVNQAAQLLHGSGLACFVSVTRMQRSGPLRTVDPYGLPPFGCGLA